MSLDAETRTALAEELEDVAMELVDISLLLTAATSTAEANKNSLEKNVNALKIEIERLVDIAELYGYEELLPIAKWAHQNVIALIVNTEQLVQRSEAGLFSTWVELLAASLQQQDDELSTELEMTLLDSDWHSAVDQQPLQALLDSLLISCQDSASTSVGYEDKVSSQTSEGQTSTYRLAPDDDIHPELLEAFFIETPDQVIEVAELIRTISLGNADKESHQKAARIAHTIKGSSAVTGIDAVASLAHKLEDILEYSVKHQLPPEVADLLVESSDCLEAMFDSLFTQSLPPQHYPHLLEQLTHWDKKFSTGYIYEASELAEPKGSVENTAVHNSATVAKEKEEGRVEKSTYRLSPDDDVHPELLEAFFIETPDQVINVAELIRTISLGDADKETHQEAARIAHTIKGSSAVVGIDAVASFAHKLEDILEYSIEQKLPPEVADLLVESSDCLEAMFDSLLTESLPPQHYPHLLEQLTHWDKKLSTGYIYEASKSVEPVESIANTAILNTKTDVKEDVEVQESTYRLAPDDDVHPELLEAFFIEAPDQVINVAELIRTISLGDADKETHQEAARIAHTIKGSSAVVGIDAVASFAHKLEDILEYSIEHKLPPEVADLLVESSDCLEGMFDSLLMQSLPPQQYPPLLEKLTHWDKQFSTGYIYQPPVTENTPENIAKTKQGSDDDYELAWSKDVHPELLEAYMGETPENVIDLSQLLREINKQGSERSTGEETDGELSNLYKKASMLAHTVKGTSAVVGINAVANIGLPLEDILDYGVSHRLSQRLLEMLDESADLLESLYDSLLSEGTPPKEYPALYKKLCDWKQHLSLEQPTKKESTVKEAVEQIKPLQKENKQEKLPPVIEEDTQKKEKVEPEFPDVSKKFTFNLPPLKDILPIPKAASARLAVTVPSIKRATLNETTLRVPVSVIDKLLSFSSELITANTQMSEQINTLLGERQNINERNDRIRHMLDELEWAVSQQSTVASKQTHNGGQTSADNIQLDSLEMDSYNELHSVTSLLSESVEDDRKMSLSLVRRLNELKTQNYIQQQVNNELNGMVLNMRMESVKILTPRLQRIVRETCRQTKKQAELEIIGDELALDTDIIKGLVDPLLHLLRNAVDHGIESKEVRHQNAKDTTGKIQLTFTQQGDQVALLLKDDGAGIDAEEVYQKAIKKGLIESNVTLSEEEKLRLILLAGFSTRDKVTETSGRGVGMDVVNSAVQSLSGDISIRSEKNKGSEVHIQVPLTLSVANVLLVDVLGNTLAIPNAFIQQVYHLSDNSVEEKQGKLFINYQEQKLPLLALSTLLSWPASRLISDKSQSVLIINHHSKRYALYADQILKPLNITIKTLKPWMTNVIGVNGVCLLPNGIVAPVLNLFDLLRTSVQNALDMPLNITDSATININQNKILVVDDSLSNRIALRLMLEALGHEVGTAVDGADALQQIEKAPFKLVITDLEMPNMNGLEMVESLRVWTETKNTPIIMVTSRSTAKHRTLAAEAGVDEYLTKPVDSKTLQATIEKYEMSDNIKEG